MSRKTNLTNNLVEDRPFRAALALHIERGCGLMLM